MNKLTLVYKGRDSWSRPVYERNGKLYVDVEPMSDREPKICTKQSNAFDGEPLQPIPEGTELEFIPSRDVWR